MSIEGILTWYCDIKILVQKQGMNLAEYTKSHSTSHVPLQQILRLCRNADDRHNTTIFINSASYQMIQTNTKDILVVSRIHHDIIAVNVNVVQLVRTLLLDGLVRPQVTGNDNQDATTIREYLFQIQASEGNAILKTLLSDHTLVEIFETPLTGGDAGSGIGYM